MKYFSEWIPEWEDRYCNFHEEDIARVCTRHHDEAHERVRAALADWWTMAEDEKTRDGALVVASECSASFWSWVREGGYSGGGKSWY